MVHRKGITKDLAACGREGEVTFRLHHLPALSAYGSDALRPSRRRSQPRSISGDCLPASATPREAGGEQIFPSQPVSNGA